MLILAYFTKNELYGQNDNSIPKPLLCLKFLQNSRNKIMKRFLDNCKKMQKRAKKGKKGQKRGKKIIAVGYF